MGVRPPPSFPTGPHVVRYGERRVGSGPLAFWAVVGASGGLAYAADSGATDGTGVFLAVVNEQSFLVMPGGTEGGAVVKKAVALSVAAEVQGDGAAGVDGFVENFADRGAEAGEARLAEGAGAGARGNAGAEQGFAGVNVTHARQQRLVEQLWPDSHESCE